jgi:hypothetical protein
VSINIYIVQRRNDLSKTLIGGDYYIVVIIVVVNLQRRYYFKVMDEISTAYEKICEICTEKEGIYKCPRCSIFTCSLLCCKQHKIDKNCNGKRDKTSFVQINEFTTNNLKSDMHFLEDVLVSKFKAKRVLENDCGGQIKPTKIIGNKRKASGGDVQISSMISHQNLEHHSQHTKKLVKESQTQQINLIVMPEGMSKRQVNTSRWNNQTKQIDWKVHVIIVLKTIPSIQDLLQRDYISMKTDIALIENLYMTCVFHKVSQNTTIQGILDKLVAIDAVRVI